MAIANRMRRSFAGLLLAALAWAAHGSAAAQARTESLNLAIASPALIYGPVWVALAESLFEKNGVKVNVVSTNALTTGPAMLVSGSADLLATTTFLGLRIALEGKQLSLIYNLSNMSMRANAFVAKPSIKSMEQLAAMGTSCRVILLPTGSAGWAIYQGLAAQYKLKCATSTAGTTPLVIAGALSGQFDAALLNPQDAYSAREAGKVNVLLDPMTMGDAEVKQIYRYEHPLSTVFGLRETVAGKREAVVRFVKALRQAGDLIAKMSPQQLAEMSRRLTEAFGTTPANALAQQWQIQKTMIPASGAISEPEWTSLVAAAPLVWGFANLNPAEPALKYGSIIDMSYFNTAK